MRKYTPPTASSSPPVPKQPLQDTIFSRAEVLAHLSKVSKMPLPNELSEALERILPDSLYRFGTSFYSTPDLSFGDILAKFLSEKEPVKGFIGVLIDLRLDRSNLVCTLITDHLTVSESIANIHVREGGSWITFLSKLV